MCLKIGGPLEKANESRGPLAAFALFDRILREALKQPSRGASGKANGQTPTDERVLKTRSFFPPQDSGFVLSG